MADVWSETLTLVSFSVDNICVEPLCVTYQWECLLSYPRQESPCCKSSSDFGKGKVAWVNFYNKPNPQNTLKVYTRHSERSFDVGTTREDWHGARQW